MDLDAVRWSAYAGSDVGALLFDPDGYVYVGSHVSQMSGSCSFAHAPGTSAVIFKLDANDGSMVWCGSIGDGFITSLQLAGDGGLIVAGTTQDAIALSEGAFDSTRDGLSDLFIVKLHKEDGAHEWGTYLGGSDHDTGIDVAVGSTGQVLFATGTESEDFPLSATGWGAEYRGGHDVVIGALSADGTALLWSRDIGGTGFDGAEIYYDKPNLALDDAGNVYVITCTASTDLPTDECSLFPDHFGSLDTLLASVTQDGETCNWMTYFGSVTYDMGRGLALVPSGVLVIGSVWSIDGSATLPVSGDASDDTLDGISDAYVMELKDPAVVGLIVAQESLAQEGDDVVLRWRLNAEVELGDMMALVDVGGATHEVEIRRDGDAHVATDPDVCRDGACDRTYTIWMRDAAGGRYPLVQRSYTPLCGAPAWSLRAAVAAGGGVDFLLQAGRPATVVVEVFDLAGRRLIALPAAQVATGETSLGWDGRDDRGRAVPGGKYVARCVTDGRTLSAPFVVLR
jgi:hypothetical protein